MDAHIQVKINTWWSSIELWSSRLVMLPLRSLEGQMVGFIDIIWKVHWQACVTCANKRQQEIGWRKEDRMENEYLNILCISSETTKVLEREKKKKRSHFKRNFTLKPFNLLL
jgi:hypothetical protein